MVGNREILGIFSPDFIAWAWDYETKKKESFLRLQQKVWKLFFVHKNGKKRNQNFSRFCKKRIAELLSAVSFTILTGIFKFHLRANYFWIIPTGLSGKENDVCFLSLLRATYLLPLASLPLGARLLPLARTQTSIILGPWTYVSRYLELPIERSVSFVMGTPSSWKFHPWQNRNLILHS